MQSLVEVMDMIMSRLHPGFVERALMIGFAGACLALACRAFAQEQDKPAWTVGARSFQPGRSDAAIAEGGPALAEMGGTVYLRVDNAGAKPLVIKDLLLGDRPVEEVMRTRHVFWWRARPQPVPPGRSGVVEICADGSIFPYEGKSPRITLMDADGGKIETGLRLVEEKLIPGYVYRDGGTLRLFVRNESPWRIYTIQGLTINNVVQKAEIKPEVVAPGQPAMITVEGFDTVPVREPIVVQVDALNVAGNVVTVMRACTLVDPRFPIGVWQSSSDFRDSHEYRQQMTDARFDTPFMGVEEIGARPDYYFKDFLEKYDYRPMGNPRPFLGDPTNPHLKPEVVAFFERYGAHDRFICYNSAEEPDWHEPKSGYSVSYEVLQRTELVRRHAPRHPIAGTLCRSRRFYEFAPILDVPIMDSYRVGAPSADRWPFIWGNYLESCAAYTRDLKQNAEPAPVWVWAQGIHGWSERAFVPGSKGAPIPTPSEARAQLYMQLGSGAKGVLWFRYERKHKWMKQYEKEAKEYAAKLPFVSKDYAEKFLAVRKPVWEKLWEETWAAMKEMNLEMCMLRPLLSRGDVYPSVWVRNAGNPNRFYLGAVASAESVVLFAVNLDYKFHSEGYRFTPQENVSLAVTPPAWLAIESAWTLKADKTVPIELHREGGNVYVNLDRLEDGAVVVLGAKDLASRLTPKTQSLIPKLAGD